MNQVTKYLNKELFLGISLFLFGGICLFSFFEFIQEISDLDDKKYGVTQAIVYVLLTIPGHIYKLIPTAVLIGAMYTVGQLSHQSELIVLRSSGLSIKQIARAVMPIAIFFSILTFAVGDLITPNSEKNAQQLKTNATNTSISMEFKSGFWMKDGNNFVNIENVLPDASLSNIHIYEFDDQFNLRTIIDAKNGKFDDGNWDLTQITVKNFLENQIITEKIEKGNWKSLIRPEMMNVLIISPDKMSIFNLVKFINYLKINNQRSSKYETALWEKLINPLMPIVMILFALPFGFLQQRSGGKFLKMFIGISIGIGYQIINTLFRHLGLLNDWPPFLSSLLPFFFISVSRYIYDYEVRTSLIFNPKIKSCKYCFAPNKIFI
jgi:lipopolysaccharide export system permease protein